MAIATVVRSWLYVWYGCGVVGFGLLSWSAVDWQRAASFQQLAVRSRGMIIGADLEDLGRGRTRYFPKVEFMTPDARRHRFMSRTWRPWPPRVGEEVRVLYDPVMPDFRARLDEPDDRGLYRLLLAVMGLGLTLVGVSPFLFRARLTSGKPEDATG